MLFSVRRLAETGFPAEAVTESQVAATLDALHAEMHQRYRARQRNTLTRLGALRALLHDPGHWWNRSAEHARARDRFDAFIRNVERNFGEQSTGNARIDSAANWAEWRRRQLAAIRGLGADRQAWRQALDVLSPPITE